MKYHPSGHSYITIILRQDQTTKKRECLMLDGGVRQVAKQKTSDIAAEDKYPFPK
jgi:hypothetical protein